MGYEVDLLPVRAGGAAACVRWGTPDQYKVLVYDGGTAVSGERLVAHIERQYMTSRVDYVVSSHPAGDHVAGLAVVLRKLKVGELWMQRPWAYAAGLRTELPAARALKQLADSKRIPVREPFAGAGIGPFMVLAPQRDWYVDHLIPEFGQSGAAPRSGLAARLGRWTRSQLRADATTSAENESSSVLYAEFEGRGVLLTGRAGIRALDAAASFAEQLGLDLPANLRLLQLPNGGCADHLSAEVLDRIVGPSGVRGDDDPTKSAFISMSLSGQHPSRAVTRALEQRGVVSFVTNGMSLHHWHQMPDRGWYRAQPAYMRA
ncbi:hypothetical protein QTH90_12695 [Variovorax sp. J2P1-59]|uniref:MBL fold metallo-hydrolase n=1 Tax=Variovorax flavidus TaxID=3053501 RepID=UPI0025781D54|nr:MBL fold metallo-hydrolase [Variovorax sp. J2P1-59]MDM0075249.1 hypothetical protein [Variovorax sp. J2P1-59]